MNNSRYDYPAEKLSAARNFLVLLHPKGEAASYAEAFHQCWLGLMELSTDDLDDAARSWVATIKRTMDTTRIQDPSGRGTWAIKIEQLSSDEKHEFSEAVDELAYWLGRRCHGQD